MVSDEEHKFYSYAAIVSDFRHEYSENHTKHWITQINLTLKIVNLRFLLQTNAMANRNICGTPTAGRSTVKLLTIEMICRIPPCMLIP